VGVCHVSCLLCMPNASVASERAFPVQIDPLFVILLQTVVKTGCHPPDNLFLASRASLRAIKDNRTCLWSTFSPLRLYLDTTHLKIINRPPFVAFHHITNLTTSYRHANSHVCTRSVAPCACTESIAVSDGVISHIHRNDNPATKVERRDTSCHRGQSEGRSRWDSHQNVSQSMFITVNFKQETKHHIAFNTYGLCFSRFDAATIPW
jgi:hypothetical protein